MSTLVTIASTIVVSSGHFVMPLVTASFSPGVDDGYIPDGAPVDLDASMPAISRLDPALRDALAEAAADAEDQDGLSLRVTSGWRSTAYQQHLFERAVLTYGSAEVAREFVAAPQDSSHVTGDAVDVAPLDMQLWLMDHGAGYGLCQIYANERWHWELATRPGRACPDMLEDASAARR